MRVIALATLITPFVWPLVVASTLSTAVSCRTRPDSATTPVTPERVAAYAAALTRFERDSVEWARGPIVRDSISRTINTDSLYHLYHVLLHSANPIPIIQLLHCEEFRLVWRYGAMPTIAAKRRMADTLFTPAERKLADERDAKLDITTEDLAILRTGPKACGPMGPMQPTIVGGAHYDAEEARPVRPMKP